MKKYRMPRKAKKDWKKKIDSATTTTATATKTTESLTYKKLLKIASELENLKIKPSAIRYLPFKMYL